MANFVGCQLPNVPKLSEGLAQADPQPFIRRLKRTLAAPWNYHVKRWLKKAYRIHASGQSESRPDAQPQQRADQLPRAAETEAARPDKLKAGDRVRVRAWEEIQPMLDPFKETRGCAFLEDMRKYCGTEQRVLKSMERFLDERDYKVKKARGVILLENVICEGTPAFGRCDRSCFLFWREEWLEKIEG